MRRSVNLHALPPVTFTVIWFGQFDTAVTVGTGPQAVGAGLVYVEYWIADGSPNCPIVGQLLAATMIAYGVPIYNGMIVFWVPAVSAKLQFAFAVIGR